MEVNSTKSKHDPLLATENNNGNKTAVILYSKFMGNITNYKQII